jgi:hypothetical protein
MEDVSLVLYSREIDSAFTTVQGFRNRTLAPVGRALKEKALALKEKKCYELRHLEPMQVPPLLVLLVSSLM